MSPFRAGALRTVGTGLAVLVVVAGLAARPAWDLYWRVPGRVDFFVHHRTYEAAVRSVKAGAPPAPGAEMATDVGGTRVFARRDSAGHWLITVISADWGHMGMGAYVYGDIPPKSYGSNAFANFDAPGDLWTRGEQLGTHWWTAFNNLQ